MDNTLILDQFAKWKQEGSLNKVIVKVTVHSVAEFETSTATCIVDVGVQMFWADPTFANTAPGEPHFAHGVFQPELEFRGGRRLKKIIRKEQGGHYWIHPEFVEAGIVHFYQRYRGKLHQELHLSEFPFDEQTIEIKFTAAMLSADQFEFVNWTEKEAVRSWEAPLEHTLHEWVLEHDITVETGLEYSVEDKRMSSFLPRFLLPVQRNVGLLLVSTCFLIVFFISVVNWWSFLLKPELLDQKLIINISCFLTLVALNFVIAEKTASNQHAHNCHHLLYRCLCHLRSLCHRRRHQLLGGVVHAV